ncbi:MAG: haloacid dehalogenase [Anaerolineales bacterium]|nr:haloacid dehalogenase [Anaerolineales bacterium]
MDELAEIAESIRQDFTTKNAVRDQALQRSRQLIRLCSHAIRATHREEWEKAAEIIKEAEEEAAAMVNELTLFPDLYHSGYAQDALKEYVEAHLTFALIRKKPLPTPESLNVEPSTYLGGMAEAATELRRRILDIIRHRHDDEAERLLEIMDAIYGELITIDFPDAITYGLRRRTDVLRGVLERTRGDLTNSLRQQQLQEALRDMESRLGSTDPTS